MTDHMSLLTKEYPKYQIFPKCI